MYRLTPRQVVVIIPRSAAEPRLAALVRDIGPSRMDDLLLATMRDAIAAAVRVDGATIAVVAPSQTRLEHLRQILPAGLEFVAPTDPVTMNELSRFALTAHQGREFERILVVDSAVLRLSSRAVGTGLGALASADVVVGATRHGSPWAFGLLERHTARFLEPEQRLTEPDRNAAELVAQLRSMRFATRRIDPLPTIDGFKSLDELRFTMANLPGLGRHVGAFLAHLPWVEPPVSDQFRHLH